MHTRYLDSIRSFEGFTPTAKWDYGQQTNGFGTKALHAGEKISRVEAERRFAIEIRQARQFVEKHAKDWDDGTKAALTSLTFNAGTRWASSGLGEAIRRSDVDAVKSHFLAYTKAGGVDLPGLIKRRLAEVTWIGEQAVLPSTKTTEEPPTASPAPQAPLPMRDRYSLAAAPQHAQVRLVPAAAGSLNPDTQMASSAWLLLLLEHELFRSALGGSEAGSPRTPRTHLGA